jgi:hypothetical protein
MFLFHRSCLAVLLLFLAGTVSLADDTSLPKDNPVAAFYAGPEGYPAWTDGIRWSNVINMKTYKGKNEYEKFVKARDELANAGGGVLYYPAGTYDFTSTPRGNGLGLSRNVVIRGEAPPGHVLASDGKLELPTKFIFNFRKLRGDSQVPNDWNLINLHPLEGGLIKEIDNVGIAWVHLVGATVYFGPEFEWGKTWVSSKGILSDHIKKVWAKRPPNGTHPGDVLTDSGKKYVGAGKGRLVFGCVFQDAAVLDDFSDLGSGPDGFHTQHYCARVIAYGSRVLIANNFLPPSKKNFRYTQKTRPDPSNKGSNLLLFDYGKTCGIDVNKNLYINAHDEGKCPGYYDEGVVVRDNYVYNHGQKGFSIAGKWVTIANNRNERTFLRQGDDAYGLNLRYALTVDGWQCSGTSTDNFSRAFELAGRNLWVDGNRFNNTGSAPGDDGEGIVCRPQDGTPLYSWAITHNVHTKGTGAAGLLGGRDVDCHGLLIGWNQTAGWVGNAVTKKDVKMADCAFVANKCASTYPDAKTVTKYELMAPLTARVGAPPAAPKNVIATADGDAVKITWTDAAETEAGFRVERRIEEGKWYTIAYRPPQIQKDVDNPTTWVDFTAPPGKPLSYRVVALTEEDNDRNASEPTAPVTLMKPE